MKSFLAIFFFCDMSRILHIVKEHIFSFQCMSMIWDHYGVLWIGREAWVILSLVEKVDSPVSSSNFK